MALWKEISPILPKFKAINLDIISKQKGQYNEIKAFLGLFLLKSVKIRFLKMSGHHQLVSLQAFTSLTYNKISTS